MGRVNGILNYNLERRFVHDRLSNPLLVLAIVQIPGPDR